MDVFLEFGIVSIDKQYVNSQKNKLESNQCYKMYVDKKKDVIFIREI